MKVVIGTKDQYYIQTNNAQVELMRDYFQKKRYIACGPTSFVAGLDISGYDMKVFTPGVQPEDAIIMLLHNPNHLGMWRAIRDLDYDKYPPNEVPQLYPGVGRILYKKEVCKFSWGINLDIIKREIDDGLPVMVGGKFSFGGHYVLIVGYDGDRVIYNDPYPLGYADGKGYNLELSPDDFERMISKYKITFI